MMRFKQIALQGFKSFVDKTVVDFPDGVTCVVGPNGSGKSNIMDAFRWVFGEQNVKELRGSGMEDIIFSGSEGRKPSGFAEVSLTLSDLSDETTAKWGTFSEITVGRKYYRSGEREYLINNRKCKLKDIKEIFFDTGIGARSISIIEQGKVEKIINATPEDLRLFFEETAGVVKYKERKKESERRLRQTWDNLARINDIISEIHTSIQTLETQVSQLNVYKSLNTQKIELEKTYYASLYASHLNELKSIQTILNDLKIKLTGHVASFEEKRQEEIGLKEQLIGLQADLKIKNEQILALNTQINSEETDIKLLESHISGADSTKTDIENDIDVQTDKLKKLTERKTESMDAMSLLEKRVEEVESIVEDVQEILDSLTYQKESIDDEIAAVEKRFLEVTQEIADHRNSIYRFENNLLRFQKERERFIKEKEEIAGDQQRQFERITELQKTVEGQHVETESLKDRLMVSSTLEEDLNLFIQQLNLDISKIKVESEVSQRNVQLSKEQVSTLSFGDEGNREIFNALGAGLILDFIPMEGHLLDEVGDVLVFDIPDKSMVFEKLKEVNGAFRFIFKYQLEAFEKYLLSCSVEDITDDIYQFENVYRLKGEENKAHQLAVLKSEISVLEDSIQQLQSEQAQKDELLKEKQEAFETCRMKNASMKDELRKLEVDCRTAENELKGLEQTHERYARRLSVIDKEIEMNQIDENKNKQQLSLLTEKLDELAARQADIDEEKQDMDEKRQFLLRKMEDEKETLSAHKVNLRGDTEKIKAIKREIHFIEQDMVNSTSQISNDKKRLDQLLNVNLTGWQSQLNDKAKQLLELKKRQVEQTDQKQQIENQIVEQNSRVETCGKQLEQYATDMKQIETSIADAELKKVQYVTERTGVIDTYEEKFHTALEECYEELVLPDFQPRKMKGDVTRLTNEIDALGPLNMAAEVEFEEVQERHEFLLQQREDLEVAIAKINELISEINDNTAIQFKETFDSVSANFQDVFKILFGEGKAKLTLTDPENLLTTGVDIFVQPPGKKLQNMNLLSGGEKAMTACTLLFAMFLHKPTPFCFLDEIDAPLDDANIARFIKIVKKLSRHSQFVIITHNQKTMAEANSLYGVTMQEPGISKLLSVRLDHVH